MPTNAPSTTHTVHMMRAHTGLEKVIRLKMLEHITARFTQSRHNEFGQLPSRRDILRHFGLHGLHLLPTQKVLRQEPLVVSMLRNLHLASPPGFLAYPMSLVQCQRLCCSLVNQHHQQQESAPSDVLRPCSFRKQSSAVSEPLQVQLLGALASRLVSFFLRRCALQPEMPTQRMT